MSPCERQNTSHTHTQQKTVFASLNIIDHVVNCTEQKKNIADDKTVLLCTFNGLSMN